MIRLDKLLSNLGYCSRKEVGRLVKSGALTRADGTTFKKASDKVVAEDVRLDGQPLDPTELLIMMHKPAGYTCSHRDRPPLIFELLPERFAVRDPKLSCVGRLDKDTTGLMVVAKTLQAQTNLVAQLQDRSMGREYEAVVQGHMTGGGKVDEPIGRHGTQRTKMAVNPMGKEAITHYRVLHRFPTHTYIRLKLETGRTHQIRVHMAHIGYPLVGDSTYAARTRLTKGIGPDLRETLLNFKRQALHARKLGLMHPVSGEFMEWEVDLPDDFVDLLAALEADADD